MLRAAASLFPSYSSESLKCVTAAQRSHAKMTRAEFQEKLVHNSCVTHSQPHPRPVVQRQRDRLLRASTSKLRIALINNTHSARTARQLHGLSDTTTRLLGRAMASASLLASTLKGEERVILEWRANGPLSTLYAEAIRTGEVRGYVSDPHLEMPATTNLGYAMRTGTLHVTEILYGQKKPYTSVVEIAGADVVSDMRHYFRQVEQVPTHLDLDTYLQNGEVLFSGGLLIQPLPQATPEEAEELLEQTVHRLRGLPPVHVLFTDDAMALDDVLRKLSDEPIPESAIDRQVLDFYCRCKPDDFVRNLRAMDPESFERTLTLLRQAKEERRKLTPKDELESELIGEVRCMFCNRPHEIKQETVEEIRKEMEAKKAQSQKQ